MRKTRRISFSRFSPVRTSVERQQLIRVLTVSRLNQQTGIDRYPGGDELRGIGFRRLKSTPPPPTHTPNAGQGIDSKIMRP